MAQPHFKHIVPWHDTAQRIYCNACITSWGDTAVLSPILADKSTSAMIGAHTDALMVSIDYEGLGRHGESYHDGAPACVRRAHVRTNSHHRGLLA